MQPYEQATGNSRRPERSGELVIAGRAPDLPLGCGATVELPQGKELAVFNVNGEFFAIENFCPHKGGPLADGNLLGHTIQCDWHGWCFDLRTGECVTHPGENIETYEVIVEDTFIKIRV